MSQDPNENNNNNDQKNPEPIVDENEEIISRTNEMLENLNRTFRMTRQSRLLNQLDPTNPINQMIISNSENLDRVLETRRNLRLELETTRCNYVLSANSFCRRRKTNGSDYCVYHANEFNGVNYGMSGRPRLRSSLRPLPRLPIIPRRPRRLTRSLEYPNLNISSTSDLTSSIEITSSNLNPNLDISSTSNLNPNLDISSTSNLQDLNTTSVSSSNPNISVEISNSNPNVSVDISYSRVDLDPDMNPNLNLSRHRLLDLPALPPLLRRSFRIPSAVSLGVTDNQNISLGVSGPEINLFNLISSRVSSRLRSRDNLAELKENKNKNGKCILCKKTVADPKVVLNCDHQYHLKCYMILNTDSDNKYDIMENCMECEKPIDLNIPESKDCSICLEKLIDDDIEIELPCKHRFHIYCIQRWVDINKNCPLCRKTF